MSQDDSLSPPPGPQPPRTSFGAMVAILLVVAVVGLSWVMGQRTGPTPPPSVDQPLNPTIAPESPKPSPKATSPRETPPPIATPIPSPKPKSAKAPATDRYKVRNLTLKNQDGKVIYRGDMDLTGEIARIKEGDKLPFSHDGTIFQNREGRLPRKETGYYHEWVVLTPGQSGPGPQRIITGKGGELYYTHDHYKTFQQLPDK